MEDHFSREAIRAALQAAEENGGIEVGCPDSCGCGYNHAVNPEGAMRAALRAALRRRAVEESRAAMAALPLRVAAHLARPSGTPEMHS